MKNFIKILIYLFAFYSLLVVGIVTVMNIVSDGYIMSVYNARVAYGYINSQLFGIANFISYMVLLIW